MACSKRELTRVDDSVRRRVGDIPNEWEAVRLGDVFSHRKEAGIPGLPVMSVTMNDGLVERNALDRRVTSDLGPEKHLLAYKGDLAYNTMRMWQGVSGIAICDCLVSPAYVVCSPSDRIWPEFAAHFFKATAMIEKLGQFSQGLTDDRLRLYFHNFAAIPAVLPPLPEQKKIAAILGSVDEAIQATQAVIDQTRKVKQGLLQQLLTRGIGHTRFKKTEIGEIPVEWEVCEVGDLVPKNAIRNGLYKPATEYGNGGTPIIRIDDFSFGDKLFAAPPNLVRTTPDEQDAFGVERGDLLVNRVNSLSHLGKCALVASLEQPTVFESNMMCVRVSPPGQLVPEYLLRLLSSRSARNQIASSAKRAVAQASINQQDVRGFRFPIPPVDEQEQIIVNLTGVEAAEASIEEEEQKLRDLKRGLMQDLLTGQVRVKGAA